MVLSPECFLSVLVVYSHDHIADWEPPLGLLPLHQEEDAAEHH